MWTSVSPCAEVFREEDLDEILARADRELPADDAAEQEDGASSLMDAFKVGQCLDRFPGCLKWRSTHFESEDSSK
jgi:hypothetical protein